MNPLTTGAAVMAGGISADLVIYLLTLLHVSPLPSVTVAGSIAAIIAGTVHWVANVVSAKMATPSTPPAPKPAA